MAVWSHPEAIVPSTETDGSAKWQESGPSSGPLVCTCSRREAAMEIPINTAPALASAQDVTQRFVQTRILLSLELGSATRTAKLWKSAGAVSRLTGGYKGVIS